MSYKKKFDKEIADVICKEISTSNKSLKTICKELKINVSSVLNWLNDKGNDSADFAIQYARAKGEQADFLAEEIIEIADDATRDTITITRNGKQVEVENTEWTNRSRLRVDARKWVASKLKPKKYGDKIDLTTQGDKITSVIANFGTTTPENKPADKAT